MKKAGSSQFFLIQDEYQPRNSDFHTSSLHEVMLTQSPEVNLLQRGRTLQSGKSLNSSKKGVLVIKRESINRQNSHSRSPTNEINTSLESPYHSPKANQIMNGSIQSLKQNLRGEQVNLQNSNDDGPVSEDTKHDDKEGLYDKSKQGRNSNIVKYHPFIQRSIYDDILHQNQMTESLHHKSVPIRSDNYLLQKFDENKMQRDTLLKDHNLHDNSSESDDIFERQSSNAFSVDNLINNGPSRKIVISKRNVNFSTQVVQDHSRSQGHLHKMKTQLELDIQRQHAKRELDQMVDFQQMFGKHSMSPDCLRRQKSDNIISITSSKNLNHERSQNQLSLHVSHKFEAPKVVKAIPNSLNHDQIIRSPTTSVPAFTTQKDDIQGITKKSQLNSEQSIQLMNKSRQTNIFQMRRSQTVTQQESQPQKVQQNDNQTSIKKSPVKKQEQRSNKQSEISRVSQSLLLDNFFSRSKERVDTKYKERSIHQDVFSAKSGDFINSSTGASSLKVSPEVQTLRDSSKDSKTRDPNEVAVPIFLHNGRRSTLTYHINKLIDENRCSSPVRVSQYLLDIDQLKERASQNGIYHQQALKMGDLSSVSEQRQKHTSFSNTNSNNAIMSLSQANTTEKFKEIIDNLFVPTASAFKKKSPNEKQFRRPTQNPQKRSKSQQRTCQNRQRTIQTEGEALLIKWNALVNSKIFPLLKKNLSMIRLNCKIRDDLQIDVFVNHYKLDDKGNPLSNHSTADHNVEGSDISDDDQDEDVDPEKDEEEENSNFTNRYVVDFIAQYNNPKEDLIFHWGIGMKQACQWERPDDKYLPPNTIRFSDNKACQTTLALDHTDQAFRTAQYKFQWTQNLEPPVKSMSYVVLEKSKNMWHNNGGRDFHIKFQIEPEHHKNKNLPMGKIGDVVNEIIECEAVYIQSMQRHSIRQNRPRKQRSCVIINFLKFRAYLYIWLRYSFTKQLTWQKSYNTKPKDLQWAQVCLTDEIVNQYKRVAGKNRQTFLTADDLLRSMLSMIGKGAGNGQRVRDEILNIMHRHKISETAGHFYEQWHQKLHNNTTPDDIYICEGLLAYLKSGNLSKYWEILSANGITKERLASYERKITTEPWMKPEAIGDFQEYLSILKQMHSSGDLEILSNEAKQHLGNDTKSLIDDLMRNYNDQDTLRQMERVSKLRFNLHQSHMDYGNPRKLKDIMFLDLALESYLRALTERIIHIDIGFDAFIRETAIILSNLCLSYQWDELNVCKEDWDKIVQINSKDMNEDNARKLKSVFDRVKQSLGEVNDQFTNLIQAKAELLGKEIGIEEYAYKIFSEELIRGTLFFSLSMILKKIDPYIRKQANVGDWLVISQGRSHGSRGYIERVKNLSEVMHHTYDKRTILLCERISGEEEVPNNVQAIVQIDGTDYPDVLAHVSVRARNLKVMFTVCFDEEKIKELVRLAGKHVFMTIENHSVRFQEQNPNTPITRRASSSLILQGIIDSAKNVKPPTDFPKSFLSMDEFTPKHMGAKSNNLKILRDGLDEWIHLPQSGCIPFKMMEYTLSLHPEIEKEIHQLIDRLNNCKNFNKMNRILFKCKDLVMKLDFNPEDEHHKFLKLQLISFGIDQKDFTTAWKTIKMVWASKFNERAFLATKKIGLTMHSIFMAVLVQRVVPAEYAYVIHTSNPTNGDDEEVYVESCLGMGEALVSTMPGQAFSFTYNKANQKSVVNAYPNKPIGLKASGFIFRSDSNSEDLPGFAGAGLFDSYPMMGTTEFRIQYHKEKLLNDKQFRENFMNNIGQIGMIIEKLYNESQDIEGAYYDGKFHVVQTRPQV